MKKKKKQKSDLIPYPGELFIDGSITDEALNYIRNWSVWKEDDDTYVGYYATDINSKESINSLLSYIKKIWTYPDWGVQYKPGDNNLILHTGGVSDNELVMRYLKETFFHQFFWQMSKRGGHYYYEWPEFKS